jgi:hypothetical protein
MTTGGVRAPRRARAGQAGWLLGRFEAQHYAVF